MTIRDRGDINSKEKNARASYLGGARSNQTPATSNPDYNSANNTNISPGAEGRNPTR